MCGLGTTCIDPVVYGDAATPDTLPGLLIYSMPRDSWMDGLRCDGDPLPLRTISQAVDTVALTFRSRGVTVSFNGTIAICWTSHDSIMDRYGVDAAGYTDGTGTRAAISTNRNGSDIDPALTSLLHEFVHVVLVRECVLLGDSSSCTYCNGDPEHTDARFWGWPGVEGEALIRWREWASASD